jgi:DNA-binding MarR family transcriptional regulator
MTTPASGPAPGDRDEHCSSAELLDSWTCIVRGYTYVNRTLTEQVERETGLSAASFVVLAWLLRSSDRAAPLSTLARQAAFSSGGFTKVADRLEQAGLIQRQPSPCDRRVTNAILTPAGHAQAERALAVYCAGLRELVLHHLGADGLRAMAGQMSRLSGDPPPEFLPERHDL